MGLVVLQRVGSSQSRDRTCVSTTKSFWTTRDWTTREVPLFLFLVSKKKLCQEALSLFSFRSFIVPDITFKPLIHFELIFVHGII